MGSRTMAADMSVFLERYIETISICGQEMAIELIVKTSGSCIQSSCSERR